MIPMTFHFTFYRGTTDWRWRDIHTLCLQTCKKFTGATKLVIHYDRDGEGADWDVARSLGGVEWRPTNFSATIAGKPVSDQRLIHDVHRLRTLWEEGGWYADLDFIFLKAFNMLRDADAVIGTQCKQKSKLNCALLGAKPGSAFIKAYLDKYEEWTPDQQKHVWTYANNIPWDLSQRHSVMVLPRPAFYPVAWSNKNFWAGGKTCIKNSYAVHLWETLHPTITVADLRRTVLQAKIEEALGERTNSIVRMMSPVIVSFGDYEGDHEVQLVNGSLGSNDGHLAVSSVN